MSGIAIFESPRWLRDLLRFLPLKRDLEDREERAIIRAAERRQRDRRVQENAKSLLDALQANPESVD